MDERNKSMKDLVLDMWRHAEERKYEYWGKDEKIWKFYEGQSVCCRDLLLQHKNVNSEEQKL